MPLCVCVCVWGWVCERERERENTGVGSCTLPQGIDSTQVSRMHCRWIIYCLSHRDVYMHVHKQKQYLNLNLLLPLTHNTEFQIYLVVPSILDIGKDSYSYDILHSSFSSLLLPTTTKKINIYYCNITSLFL